MQDRNASGYPELDALSVLFNVHLDLRYFTIPIRTSSGLSANDHLGPESKIFNNIYLATLTHITDQTNQTFRVPVYCGSTSD